MSKIVLFIFMFVFGCSQISLTQTREPASLKGFGRNQMVWSLLADQEKGSLSKTEYYLLISDFEHAIIDKNINTKLSNIADQQLSEIKRLKRVLVDMQERSGKDVNIETLIASFSTFKQSELENALESLTQFRLDRNLIEWLENLLDTRKLRSRFIKSQFVDYLNYQLRKIFSITIYSVKLMAIFAYTGGLNYIVNPVLRSNEKLNSFVRGYMYFLQKSLDSLPVYTGTVYRTDYLPKDILQLFLNKNGEYVERGFLSTTRLQTYNHTGYYNVKFIIKSKTGRSVPNMPILQPYNNEKEVIFSSHTKFKITNVSLVEDGFEELNVYRYERYSRYLIELEEI